MLEGGGIEYPQPWSESYRDANMPNGTLPPDLKSSVDGPKSPLSTSRRLDVSVRRDARAALIYPLSQERGSREFEATGKKQVVRFKSSQHVGCFQFAFGVWFSWCRRKLRSESNATLPVPQVSHEQEQKGQS